MNLDEAFKAHGEWKMKFRLAMASHEQMDAATIAKDNCCNLGKWLHGEGKLKYVKLNSFKDCVDKHAAFHQEACKVAEAINSKQYTKAEALMDVGSKYAKASSAVGLAIMTLKKEAKL